MVREDSNRKVLREAILQAFDPASLKRTLAEGTPPRKLEQFVSPGNFNDQIFELIDHADKAGWLPELIDTLLLARAGNAGFVSRAKPAAEQLAAGKALDDEAVGLEKHYSRSFMRLILLMLLSLNIIGLTAGVTLFTGTLPLWTAAPLVFGTPVLALALIGLAAPGNPIVESLLSFDRRIIPGLGVIGLVLTLALSGSAVGFVMEYLAHRVTVPVVAVLQDGTAPLPDKEIFAELAASAEAKPQRTWSRTSSPNAEAIFKLRPNEFYRFGVKMMRDQGVREGVFPARIITDRARIEFDLSKISKDAWIEPGHGSQIVVVGEGELSVNLPADVRSTIKVSRETNVVSPEAILALRKERGPLGLPSAPWLADRRFFTIGYDPQKRRPVFVAFKVEPRGEHVPRSDQQFKLDPLLPPEVQPNPQDFIGSGYDRGHLVRVGDVRPDAAAVEEAYYLSAVVPQTSESNRRSWFWVEDYTTNASAGTGGPIWVIAGPLYRRAPSGKERVVVLGTGATPVPTDLFRILARRRGNEWEVQSFLVPNDESTGEKNPLRFASSVAAIEQLTGLTLLPGLSPEQKEAINKSDWRTAGLQ